MRVRVEAGNVICIQPETDEEVRIIRMMESFLSVVISTNKDSHSFQIHRTICKHGCLVDCVQLDLPTTTELDKVFGLHISKKEGPSLRVISTTFIPYPFTEMRLQIPNSL